MSLGTSFHITGPAYVDRDLPKLVLICGIKKFDCIDDLVLCLCKFCSLVKGWPLEDVVFPICILCINFAICSLYISSNLRSCNCLKSGVEEV